MFNVDFKQALLDLGDAVLMRARELTVRNSMRLNGFTYDSLRTDISVYANDMIGYRTNNTIADFSAADMPSNHILITGTPAQVLAKLAEMKTPRIIGKAFSHNAAATADKVIIVPQLPRVNSVYSHGQEGVVEIVHMHNDVVRRTFTTYPYVNGRTVRTSFTQDGNNINGWSPWVVVQDGNEYDSMFALPSLNALSPTGLVQQTVRLNEEVTGGLVLSDEDGLEAGEAIGYLDGTVFTLVHEYTDGHIYNIEPQALSGVELLIPTTHKASFSKAGAVVQVIRLEKNRWIAVGQLDEFDGVDSPYYSSSSANYASSDTFAADTSNFKDFHTMFLPTDAAATVSIPASTDSGMLLAWRNKFPIGGTMRFMVSLTGYVEGTLPHPSLTVVAPAGDTLLIPQGYIARIRGSNKEFTLTRLSETVWKIGGDIDIAP